MNGPIDEAAGKSWHRAMRRPTRAIAGTIRCSRCCPRVRCRSATSRSTCTSRERPSRTWPPNQYVCRSEYRGTVACLTRSLASAYEQQLMKSSNYVHELDKRTGEIVNAILAAQSTNAVGDSISLPGTQRKVPHPAARCYRTSTNQPLSLSLGSCSSHAC